MAGRLPGAGGVAVAPPPPPRGAGPAADVAGAGGTAADADATAEGEVVPGDPLCGGLARIVDAEPEGFLGLRASPAGTRQWNGSLVPAGFSDCWIEDGASVGAAYACSGRVLGTDGPDAPAASYLLLAAALDACFALPIWYPLAWERALDRPTQSGGREAMWQVAGPGPRVSLALDQHPDRPIWFVRLRVAPATQG